jgi:hypothetical protein
VLILLVMAVLAAAGGRAKSRAHRRAFEAAFARQLLEQLHSERLGHPLDARSREQAIYQRMERHLHRQGRRLRRGHQRWLRELLR